jgi:hypothetical protein
MQWSRLGVFDLIFAALTGEGPKPDRIMIDVPHLKVHRTAASLFKEGLCHAVGPEEHQSRLPLHARAPG